MAKNVIGTKLEYSQASTNINKTLDHLNVLLNCENSWDGSFYKFEIIDNSIVLFRISLDGGNVKTKVESFGLTDNPNQLISESSDIIDWELLK